MVGGLPYIARGMCFYYSVELEHSMHQFLSCPMARMVRRCINLVWLSLSGVKLSSFYWVFAYLKNSELMPHFQIFEFLSCVVVQLEYVECRHF